MRRLRFFCLLLLKPCWLACQNTIHVPADQPSIQAGINAAHAGDTVLVAPGTYVENIDFLAKQSLFSAPGMPPSQSSTAARAVRSSASPTLKSVPAFSGFTLRSGQIIGGNATVAGAIIVSSSPTLLNNLITENLCNGVKVLTATPLLMGNTISNSVNNQSCGLGGGSGVDLQGGVNVALTGGNFLATTIIENNQHGDLYDGAGIQIFASGPVVIENNTIRNNASTGVGGAISMVNSNNLLLIGNVIANNHSVRGWRNRPPSP